MHQQWVCAHTLDRAGKTNVDANIQGRLAQIDAPRQAETRLGERIAALGTGGGSCWS
jgi:hypothetical protein